MSEDIIESGTNQDNKEDIMQAKCRAEIYDREHTPWSDIRDQILRIENLHFGEDGFDEELFKKDFGNPNNTVVLLRDIQSREVVGFTYAEPLSNLDLEDWEEMTTSEQWPNPVTREDNGERTAYVSDTAIDPTYVGHHLVGIMMKKLEEGLTQRKDIPCEFLERHSSTTNRYAQNVGKAYADRIVYSKPTVDPDYGDQVFYRIKLQK